MLLLILWFSFSAISAELNLRVTPRSRSTLRSLMIYIKFQQSDYKVQLERAENVRHDESLVEECNIIAFKYNRTTTALNFTYTSKVDAEMEMFKFASNEYRIFPLRVQMNWCKALAANIAGVQQMRQCGNYADSCRIRKGIRLNFCNWVVDQSKFPPHVPNGNYKTQVHYMYGAKEACVFAVYVRIFRELI